MKSLPPLTPVRRDTMKRTIVFLIALLIATMPYIIAQRGTEYAGPKADEISSRLSVLEERMRGQDLAWRLEAVEIRRRLDELNHAHARAVEDRNKTVQKEVFEGYQKELQLWRDEVNKQLTSIAGARAGSATFSDNLLAYAAFAIAAVLLFLKVREGRADPKRRPDV